MKNILYQIEDRPRHFKLTTRMASIFYQIEFNLQRQPLCKKTKYVDNDCLNVI